MNDQQDFPISPAQLCRNFEISNLAPHGVRFATSLSMLNGSYEIFAQSAVHSMPRQFLCQVFFDEASSREDAIEDLELLMDSLKSGKVEFNPPVMKQNLLDLVFDQAQPCAGSFLGNH